MIEGRVEEISYLNQMGGGGGGAMKHLQTYYSNQRADFKSQTIVHMTSLLCHIVKFPRFLYYKYISTKLTYTGV